MHVVHALQKIHNGCGAICKVQTNAVRSRRPPHLRYVGYPGRLLLPRRGHEMDGHLQDKKFALHHGNAKSPAPPRPRAYSTWHTRPSLVAALDVVDDEFEVAVGLVDAGHRHRGVVTRRPRVLPRVGRRRRRGGSRRLGCCCCRGRRLGRRAVVAAVTRTW